MKSFARDAELCEVMPTGCETDGGLGSGLRNSVILWNIVYNGPMVRQSDVAASIEFGRYSIFPHRRQLFADGRPIALGGRAFDVLLALVEASGAVVSKRELLERVWQDRIVEENRLAGEITALRRPECGWN